MDKEINNEIQLSKDEEIKFKRVKHTIAKCIYFIFVLLVPGIFCLTNVTESFIDMSSKTDVSAIAVDHEISEKIVDSEVISTVKERFEISYNNKSYKVWAKETFDEPLDYDEYTVRINPNILTRCYYSEFDIHKYIIYYVLTAIWVSINVIIIVRIRKNNKGLNKEER